MLGLDSWIIQDGNYGDFTRGQRAELAVECYAEKPFQPSSGEVMATYLGEGAAYAMRAATVHREEATAANTQSYAVLDCGILVYTNAGEPPPDARLVASDEVHLGVDPFDYFEGLYRSPGFPPMIYTWTVEAIYMETTAWIVQDGVQQRDPNAPTTYENVEATDAWNDDSGYASYVLECSLSDTPPKTRSATAT
jgi:hypothetical protein